MPPWLGRGYTARLGTDSIRQPPRECSSSWKDLADLTAALSWQQPLQKEECQRRQLCECRGMLGCPVRPCEWRHSRARSLSLTEWPIMVRWLGSYSGIFHFISALPTLCMFVSGGSSTYTLYVYRRLYNRQQSTWVYWFMIRNPNWASQLFGMRIRGNNRHKSPKY